MTFYLNLVSVQSLRLDSEKNGAFLEAIARKLTSLKIYHSAI